MQLTTQQMPSGGYCTTDENYCGCFDCIADDSNIVGHGLTAEESIQDYHEAKAELEQEQAA